MAHPGAEGSVPIVTSCNSCQHRSGDDRSYRHRVDTIKGDTLLHTLDLDLKTYISSELTSVAESGCLEFSQRDL